jgi:hypothetical protein
METNRICDECVMECKANADVDTTFCPRRAPRAFSLTDKEREDVERAIREAEDDREAKEAGRLAKALCQRNITSLERRKLLLRLSDSRKRYLHRQRAILGAREVSRNRNPDMELQVKRGKVQQVSPPLEVTSCEERSMVRRVSD